LCHKLSFHIEKEKRDAIVGKVGAEIETLKKKGERAALLIQRKRNHAEETFEHAVLVELALNCFFFVMFQSLLQQIVPLAKK
jgi:hypothetical protein